MRYTSEMSVLERLEFLTMKAEQAVERTSGITEYRQFLTSPDAMDVFDATVLRVQVVGEMLKQVDDKTERKLLRPWYQKKSLSLQCEAPLDERIFSPQLPQEILESFRELLPFYRYFTDLCAALSRQEGKDE